MLVDRICQRGEIRSARLALASASRRAWNHPPVVENLRNVHDLPRPVRDAKCEIVVLRTVELGPKSPDGFYQRSPVHTEVTDVHEAMKQFGAPIGLQEGQHPAAVGHQPILVAVKRSASGCR